MSGFDTPALQTAKKAIQAAAAAAALSPTQSSPLIRYVSPAGSDTLNGQINRKMQTIGAALAAMAGQSSGDVQCDPGTYAETLTFGTDQSRRNIKGVKGGRAVISREWMVNGGCQQCGFYDLKFDNATGYALNITSTLSNFVIDGLTIGGNFANATAIYVAAGGSGFITIANCDLNNKMLVLADTATPRICYTANNANFPFMAGTGWTVVKTGANPNVIEVTRNNNVMDGVIANTAPLDSTAYAAVVAAGAAGNGYYLANYTQAGVFAQGDVILRMHPLTFMVLQHYNAPASVYSAGNQKTYLKKGGLWEEAGASSLTLGETPTTAYRGDRGKAAYDHSQTTGNPHGVTKSDVGLGNADNTADINKPVSTAQQTALNAKADSTALTAHTQDTANPHSVTKVQVGLGNADNTSDVNKPISTATQTALDAKLDSTILCTQANHGFAVGNVVWQDTDATYYLAQADTEAHARAGGMVVSLVDTDNFRIQPTGAHTPSVPLQNALAAQLGVAGWLLVPEGQAYYLSQTTAGQVTATKPTSGLVVPVFRKLAGQIVFLLPDASAASSGGGQSAYDFVGTDAEIFALDPATHLGQNAFATNTGHVYHSNGSAWINPNSGGATLKNNYNLGHIPTADDNAEDGYGVGSEASATPEGDIYKLVSFTGANANWVASASINFVNDKAELEGPNYLNLPTGNVAFANQVFQVANANGMVTSGSNTGGAATFSGGETAIFTVNPSATGYDYTSKVSGSPAITVDRVIQVAQTKSSLTAGNYITLATFTDGMPAGIAVGDIFNKSSAGAYTLVSSYANYKAGVIKVGAGTSARVWVQSSGTWVDSANPLMFMGTSTGLFANGAPLMVSATGGVLQVSSAVTTIAGASSSIAGQGAANTAITLTAQPSNAQDFELGSGLILVVTTDSSNNVRMRIGATAASAVTWGNEVVSTTANATTGQNVFDACPLDANHFFFVTKAGTTIYGHLVKFSGTSIVEQLFVGSTATAGSYFVSWVKCCSFTNTSTLRKQVFISAATNAAASLCFNLAYEFTLLNGVSSTYNKSASAASFSTLGNSTDSQAVRGRTIALIPSTIAANSVEVAFGEINGYLDVGRFSVSGTTITTTAGFTRVFSNGQTIMPLAIKASSVNGKYYFFLTTTASSTSAAGGTSYTYVQLLDCSTASFSCNTTFGGASLLSRMLPLPVNGQFLPHYLSATSPSPDVISIVYSSGGMSDNTSAVFTAGNTNLYQATFTANPATNTFIGWVDQGGIVYRSISPWAKTPPAGSPWLATNNSSAGATGGRVVVVWPDANYNNSIVASVLQFGNATSVNFAGIGAYAQAPATATGQRVPIALPGSIATFPQTFTPGVTYMLSTTGTLVPAGDPTATTYMVGRAINTDGGTTTRQLLLTSGSGNVSVINAQASQITNGNGASAAFTDPATGLPSQVLTLMSNNAVVGLVSQAGAAFNHLIGNTGAPSVTLGAGAGTGASATITGSDIGWLLTLTTGTAPAGSRAIVASIGFAMAYASAPIVQMTPGNDNAALLSGATMPFVPARGLTNGVTTTGCTVLGGPTALAASTTYVFNFAAIQ